MSFKVIYDLDFNDKLSVTDKLIYDYFFHFGEIESIYILNDYIVCDYIYPNLVEEPIRHLKITYIKVLERNAKLKRILI